MRTEAGPAETHPGYESLRGEMRKAATLASVGSLLGWDQETMMPPRGGALRAEQLAVITSLAHERWTSDRIGELLAACEADAELASDEAVAANLRETRRQFDRAVRLPAAFVGEFARTTSEAVEVWRVARDRSDFAAFAPWLARVVELSREKASLLGGGGGDGQYDALMEGFEPGVRSAEVERVFSELRPRLLELIQAADSSGAAPGRAPLDVELPIASQIEFNARIVRQLGFDVDAGRIDTSTHPFCSEIGPGDTRLTTRYQPANFPDALSSTMHETGHGLYEQGLPKAEHFGEPLAESASLGIHESQSRLWENMVGRSLEFWEWALPQANACFGEALAGFTPIDLFHAVNIVRPSLIRVESDEVTYNLHIMLRFDLERAMLSGGLPVAELPAAWNERMLSDLGIAVPDDRRGCLQDVHWSGGLIGYFPTYTLGNLYAAQFWQAMRSDLPDAGAQIRRGEFGELLGWLRSHIHRHGRRFTAAELCERATGAPLSPEPLVGYLERKLQRVYEL